MNIHKKWINCLIFLTFISSYFNWLRKFIKILKTVKVGLQKWLCFNFTRTSSAWKIVIYRIWNKISIIMTGLIFQSQLDQVPLNRAGSAPTTSSRPPLLWALRFRSNLIFAANSATWPGYKLARLFSWHGSFSISYRHPVIGSHGAPGTVHRTVT